jgi:hypothetical protein
MPTIVLIIIRMHNSKHKLFYAVHQKCLRMLVPVATMSERWLVIFMFALPVLHPNESELAAHGDVLAQIDKSSGGKTIWRQTLGGQTQTVA